MRRRNRARGFRLGRLLKQARLVQKLSQAEVARRAGVSQPWLSMVEAGGLILDAFDYARLADVLKLPPDTALLLAKDVGLEDGPPEAPPPPRKTRGRAGGNR